MEALMTEPTLDTLTQRLDRLERGLRRWRVLASAAWLLLAVGIAINLAAVSRVPVRPPESQGSTSEAEEEPAAEEEVRAKSFVLVDDDDAPRAVLALRPDGAPALVFSDAAGKVLWKAP
jgi:hypothetical protein